MAVPGSDQPYVLSAKQVPRQPRPGPGDGRFRAEARRLDRGQDHRQGDGQALAGGVEYFALSTNPNLRDYDGFDTPVSSDSSKPEPTAPTGSPACPGPAWWPYLRKEHYLKAPERDDEEGTTERLVEAAPALRVSRQLQRPCPDRPGQGGRFREARRDARPGLDIHGHGARAGRPSACRGAVLQPDRPGKMGARGDEDGRVHSAGVQPAPAAGAALPASGEGAHRGGAASEGQRRLDHRADAARRGRSRAGCSMRTGDRGPASN